MKNKKSIICILCLAAAFAAALAVVFLPVKGTENSHRGDYAYARSLLRYDGWLVVDKQENKFPVELPGYEPLEDGVLILENTLPKALESGTCLAFVSSNTIAEVSVDGTVIYRNTAEGQHPPVMWNYVLLQGKMAENRIRLIFTGRDSFTGGRLPEIYLGPQSEILLLAGNLTRLNLQLGLTIIFLGFFVILCALTTLSDTRFTAGFILLGLFISVLGTSLYLQTVQPDGNLSSWSVQQGLGLSLFGLLPPVYCLYLRSRSPSETGRFYTVLFWCGLGFYALIYLLAWFGPQANAGFVRLAAYIGMEILYGLCLYGIIARQKEDGRGYRFLMSAGLFALMLGMGIERFTHIGFIYLSGLRPDSLGGLVFSVLQSIAVLLYVTEYVRRQAELSRELSESRIRLMMNQLRPHFIRNSLATIRAIIPHDPDKAYRLLYEFTGYLTYNIDAIKGTELISFGEELKAVRKYLNLELEHMGDRLKVEYDIETTDFMIPPLSVQPLVENAVKHGVWEKVEGGTVRLETHKTKDGVQIIIRDDGVGFDPENPPKPKLSGHGIGMQNAVYRLEKMASGTVRTDSRPGEGTVVTITLPAGKGEKE